MNIFISHIHEEAPFASVLKECIESTFLNNVQVFVSSDVEDIPPGTKWLDKIKKSIINVDLLIILCSKQSIIRPWINFETGCCWIKKKPILPICHSGLSLSQLPIPLSLFQAIDVSNNEFPNLLLKGLAKHLNLPKIPKIDINLMMTEINKSISNLNYAIHTEVEINAHKINKELNLTKEDIISIIETWMGSRPAELNRNVIYFREVDKELKLPEGSAMKYIEIAAQRWNYSVRRKSENTILFKEEQINNSFRRKSFWDRDF